MLQRLSVLALAFAAGSAAGHPVYESIAGAHAGDVLTRIDGDVQSAACFKAVAVAYQYIARQCGAINGWAEDYLPIVPGQNCECWETEAGDTYCAARWGCGRRPADR